MVVLLMLLLVGWWLWPGGLGAIPPVAPAAPAICPVGPEGVRFPSYPVPAPLDLCGDPVPLHEPEVREELDREFTIVLWSRAQTTMWLKRAHRYFPEIEGKLRARRLPLDLKYVVLVESDLRLKARSPAGAAGPWQFIEPTAQRFRLKCDKNIDERLEFGAATDAALSYLEKLHQMFRNWPLALAAYNCGEGRVKKALADQGVDTFYHLSLPDETERYVQRVLAAKIILEAPARYGYEIPGDQLYAPLEYDEVSLTLSQEVPVRRLADACGSYYKAIKRLNPWIKSSSLCPGTFRLKIPKGTAARFQTAFRREQLAGK